jgi:regulator of sirC expression with transglutaminase-like and TPR domain
MATSAAAAEALGALRQLAAREEPDLLEASWLIAKLVDPAEDLDRARRRFAALVARVQRRREDGEQALDALRSVLFSEEGFSGDRDTYDAPENASLARALETRRGLPITLSILAVEVGRRAGVRLAGVGLPGHFVVGGEDLPQRRFLDPFEGGALVTDEELESRVGASLGADIKLPAAAFAPDPGRSVVMRMLLNLRRSWEKRDRYEDALLALDAAAAFDPEEPVFRRERGLLLLKAGRVPEAVPELEAYAAAAGDEDAAAVGKLAQVLREQGPGAAPVAAEAPPPRRIFRLEEARDVLPKVRELTEDAVFRYARLVPAGEEAEAERQEIVSVWAREVTGLGAEIKGLWLVDFDSGAGYYCWKYPEPALEYFHGYEEGFAGRVPLQ